MMADIDAGSTKGLPGSVRIAVEGCGHGTLDAIYASVQKSCEVKGWDGVDLVIIGGDFQAVRNKFDLNVTAMPVKYRDMADFHHYYAGTKVAPFLTIFVGGNHEASNYLFELYYGGWVAPNIYYLGAANVVQFGPLKIAGISGIWKGYDYRKQHYERLPYNQDDMYSIYHVRELDIRKLLSFRSQVDIGISHDWPNGVEWLGDHNRLFKHKPHLQEDAQSRKLGSIAAQQVMDRLRPPYWFSAHLHTKYAAMKSHVKKSSDHEEQLSAWNKFGTTVRNEEAQQNAKALEDEMARREIAERTGVPLTADYTVNETYKKVRLGNGLAQDVTSVSYVQEHLEAPNLQHPLPQLDGSCASLPLKRRREPSSSPNNNQYQDVQYTPLDDQPADIVESLLPSTAVNINPDAIDIEMSDEEVVLPTAVESTDETKIHNVDQVARASLASRSSKNGTVSDDPIRHEDALTRSDTNKYQSNAAAYDSIDTGDASLTRVIEDKQQPSKIDGLDAASRSDGNLTAANDVSEDMRAQLAALSSKFDDPVQQSPSLPHPEEIKNEVTKFLALSKCEDKQNFLQLLEIQPYMPYDDSSDQPPKLSYVPEWLAILRVFATELTLGGNSKATTPKHRGDTYYRERILEEEKWVQENVVKPGMLGVPQNFARTAAIYDPDLIVDSKDMPREVTNPQTSAFCDLIGIENLFDISEEERDSRMAAGPAESTNFGNSRSRGVSRGRSGNRGGFSRGGRGRGHPNATSRGRGRN